jgi:hypothetical protein
VCVNICRSKEDYVDYLFTVRRSRGLRHGLKA